MGGGVHGAVPNSLLPSPGSNTEYPTLLAPLPSQPLGPLTLSTRSLAFALISPTLSHLCVQPFFSTPQQPPCESPTVLILFIPSIFMAQLTPFTHTPDPSPEDPVSPFSEGTPCHPSQRRGRPKPGCPLVLPSSPAPPHPGGLSQAAGTGRGGGAGRS